VAGSPEERRLRLGDAVSVVTKRIACATKGHGDTIDLTTRAAKALAESGLESGVLTLFVAGSTAGLTTIEFEPGAVWDFARLFDEIAPAGREYRHHLRWGDDNGHSHVRAALLGPSLAVPFERERLALGTWQQIVLVDFDTSAREREIVAQFIGE
jgi:secondary thiamine-phosphate synthase enzyme